MLSLSSADQDDFVRNVDTEEEDIKTVSEEPVEAKSHEPVGRHD